MSKTLKKKNSFRKLKFFFCSQQQHTFLPIGKHVCSVVINVSLGRHNFLSSAHFAEQHSADFSHCLPPSKHVPILLSVFVTVLLEFSPNLLINSCNVTGFSGSIEIGSVTGLGGTGWKTGFPGTLNPACVRFFLYCSANSSKVITYANCSFEPESEDCGCGCHSSFSSTRTIEFVWESTHFDERHVFVQQSELYMH